MYYQPSDQTPKGWHKILYFDWAIFLVAILICLVGLVTLYGVADGNYDEWSKPQATRMIIGVIAMFFIAFMPFKLVKFSIIPFYLLTIVLLLVTMLFGVEINGSKRWIELGFMRLQASEFAKLSVALMIAQVFSWLPTKIEANFFVRILYSLMTVFIGLAITLIPAGMTFIQPDGGTAIFIIIVGLATMFMAGVHWLYYALGIVAGYFVIMMVGVGLVDYANERHGVGKYDHIPQAAMTAYENGMTPEAGNFLTTWVANQVLDEETLAPYTGTEAETSPVSWTEFSVALTRKYIQDYQFKRIDVLFDPNIDPTGEGYHAIQSWITLGSGGLEGRGFMQGSQTRLNFILENHTDFIFASYAEYFGFIGTLFLLILFTGFSFLFLILALRNRSKYGAVAIGAIGVMFSLFYIINLSMVIGLIPIVGVPLPWISYGGSVTLMLFIALGYAQNAHIHRPRKTEN